MALSKTNGIILRRRDMGEADRLLTIFTRKFGKIKAVSKGSRKPRSRQGGHLESLSLAEFMLWRREGRDLALVRSAALLESSDFLSREMPSFTAAQFAAELVDHSLPENDPQPKLYGLLITFLRALKTPGHAAPALLAFVVRAAQVLGYSLTLRRCAECRVRAPEAGPAWLEYTLGGLLCARCAGESARSGERLEKEVVRALLAASSSPPRRAASEAAAAGVRAVDRMLSYHQDRRVLSSGRFLDAAVAAEGQA